MASVATQHWFISNSFQPDFFTSKLRVYTRHRKHLIENASKYIAKMNKIFVLMNIQLSTVLRDITGASGKRIIVAILSGERNPQKLAALASQQVKAKPEDIAKALTGDWRDEQLFELRQSYELYQHYWQMIRQTD